VRLLIRGLRSRLTGARNVPLCLVAPIRWEAQRGSKSTGGRNRRWWRAPAPFAFLTIRRQSWLLLSQEREGAVVIAGTAALTALLRLLFFVFFVNGNRIQILGFKNLTTVQASDVVDTVPPVQKLGSLVLTTLHSEIRTILD